jgi:tetratricopeptide (TPR) repeat protein
MKGLIFENLSLHPVSSDETVATITGIGYAISAPAHLPPNSYLPCQRNPHFVGRDEELKKLHHLLTRGENVNNKVAVTGHSGVGKTQLAIEYAYRYGQFYEGGVYWINAARTEDFLLSLAKLATPMGLSLPENLPAPVRAENVLAMLCQPEPRLLILDEVEDPAVLSRCTIDGGGCRVLITTRLDRGFGVSAARPSGSTERLDRARRGQRQSWPGVTRLPLNVISKDAALALLLSRRPELLPSTNNNTVRGIADLGETSASVRLSAHAEVSVEPLGRAEKICDHLGNIPLALALAASYLERHKELSLADYLTALETIALPDQANLVDAGHKKSRARYKQRVAAAFRPSHRELAQTPGAERLFLAACQFAPASINADLLGQVAQIDPAADEGKKAFEILRALSVCQPVENGRWLLHRLLANFGQKLMSRKEAAGLRERFIVVMLGFLKSTSEATRLKALSMELPHVTKAAEIARSQKAWPWDVELCNQIGGYFKEGADDAACLLWWQRAQQICEARQPQAAQLLVTILDNIGRVLEEQGDEAGAFAKYRQALTIRHRVYGEEHPEIAESLDHVGALLRTQGNWTKAWTLHRRALAIRQKALGDDHPEVAANLMKLGEVLQAQGEFAGAVDHYEQALAIWKKIYSEQHPYVLTCLDNIATVLERQGDLAAALAKHEQALAIRKKVLGEMHPEVAMNLNSIGLVWYVQENWAGAAEHLRQALAILEEHFGPEHPDAQTVRENLAIIEREKE